jgi:hypothetical protein
LGCVWRVPFLSFSLELELLYVLNSVPYSLARRIVTLAGTVLFDTTIGQTANATEAEAGYQLRVINNPIRLHLRCPIYNQQSITCDVRTLKSFRSLTDLAGRCFEMQQQAHGWQSGPTDEQNMQSSASTTEQKRHQAN